MVLNEYAALKWGMIRAVEEHFNENNLWTDSASYLSVAEDPLSM